MMRTEEFESEDEENYGETVLLVKLLSGLFDTAGSNDIEEDYEESELLNNGTMNATWLSRLVGVEAWLDRPANNYEESELLNIGAELDRKESGSEDVGDVADIKGAKDVKGVADVRKDCSGKHVKMDSFDPNTKKRLQEEANGSNQTLMSSRSLHLPCYTKKLLERDTRFTSTMCTPSLREQ